MGRGSATVGNKIKFILQARTNQCYTEIIALNQNNITLYLMLFIYLFIFIKINRHNSDSVSVSRHKPTVVTNKMSTEFYQISPNFNEC